MDKTIQIHYSIMNTGVKKKISGFQGYRLRKIGLLQEVKREIKAPSTHFTLTYHTTA